MLVIDAELAANTRPIIDVPDPPVDQPPWGNKCSFEVLIDDFDLGADRALVRLAQIVHAADVDTELHTDPLAPGLLAIGFGGLDVGSDDHTLLDRATFGVRRSLRMVSATDAPAAEE